MPAQHNDHAWEVSVAESKLVRFDADAREGLVDRMEAAVQSSLIEIDALGLSVSQYPGEDDGHEPPSRDITSYVFEHLLPHTLNIPPKKGRPRIKGLLDLAKELKPDEFAAVLLLYADRIGDTAAVRRAVDLITKPTHPSLEPLRSLQRRRSGGRGRAESLKPDLRQRNDDIRKDYRRLLASGQSKREIPGILAVKYKPSARQIRRIIKEPDTS